MARSTSRDASADAVSRRMVGSALGRGGGTWDDDVEA